MRYKMRKIIVDGKEFVWRTGTGDPFDHRYVRFSECFVAYLKERKKGPLRIFFDMGLVNEYGQYNRNNEGIIQCDINIIAYWPRGAEHFIRYGLSQGWDPENDERPFVIKNGKEALKSLK